MTMKKYLWFLPLVFISSVCFAAPSLVTRASGNSTGTTAIANGGTGQTSAQAGLDALDNVAAATNEYVLTKDTGTGHTLFKAPQGGFWTESGSTDYLTTTANKVAIGRTSLISTEKFVVDGSTDVIQAIIRGNSTQTGNIFEVRKSDNTVNFAVSNTAGITTGGSTAAISDTNGNKEIAFVATGSAVNYPTFTNNSTGLGPIIAADGETNVPLTIQGKGTKGITLGNAYIPKQITLTDASTIATDASLGNVFDVSIGASRTMGAPTNPVNGQVITYRINQGGSGSFTITWNAIFHWTTTVAQPTLTTTAGHTDTISFRYDSGLTAWTAQSVNLNAS